MIRNATAILKKNEFDMSDAVTPVLWREGETLTASERTVLVAIPLTKETVGQKRDLRLCLSLVGERDTFSACGFVSEDGELVDDGLERGAPAVLHIPATVVSLDGVPCVRFYLMAAKGESLTLESVTTSPYADEPIWLGGADDGCS